MHAAKGLEFDVVFLPGWEEGLFPVKNLLRKKVKMAEEERRLAFVELLELRKAIISFSMNRFYQGDWIDSMASRFIEELPEKNVEKILMKKLTMMMILNLIKILKLRKVQEVLAG